METSKKIILTTWLVAAFLVLVLIIFTRPGRDNGQITAGQEMQKAIIGRWQGPHETDEFLTDGTFVFSIANGTGQQRDVSGKYSFLDATTLQLSPEGSDTKIVFTDFNIKDETMSLKSKSGKTAVYHRMAAAEGIKPNAETGSLKKAILGKWQSSGKTEIDEWSDDGGLVIQTTQGRTIVCRYEVVDSSHVQITGDRAPQARLTWAVAIKGDVMNVTVPTGNGAVTSSFVRLKSTGDTLPSPAREAQQSTSPQPRASSSREGDPALAQKRAERKRQGDENASQLKSQIAGKWKVPGHNEIWEWRDNGSLVVTTDQKKMERQYHVNGTNGVRLIDAESGKQETWILEVRGDILSVTSATDDGPLTDELVRVKANGEVADVIFPPHRRFQSSDIAGTWMVNGDSAVFSPDGTFRFGEDQGQWQATGDELVAKDNHGVIWKMWLSNDGHVLAGHWSNNNGLTGIVSMTR